MAHRRANAERAITGQPSKRGSNPSCPSSSPVSGEAACTTADPEIFFPSRRVPDAGEEAKAICADCPVRAECLEYALATYQEWGVWRGTNEHEAKRSSATESASPEAPSPARAAGAA